MVKEEDKEAGKVVAVMEVEVVVVVDMEEEVVDMAAVVEVDMEEEVDMVVVPVVAMEVVVE